MRTIRFLFLLGGLIFSLGIFAQKTRQVIDFDEGWLFARYGLQADGTRISEPEVLPNIPDFDDSEWRKLDLPHDWGIEGPFRKELDGLTGKLPWRGIGWYRKSFIVSEKDRGKCFYVDFDGAMANAEVWLNGYKIGDRPYGYVSFRVDLTPYLKWNEKNVLSVRLNTEKMGSRWYPGAGIYRHVRLVVTNPVHIAHWGVFVTTPKVTESQALARIKVRIDNRSGLSKELSYKLDIYKLKKSGDRGKKVASCQSGILKSDSMKEIQDSVDLYIDTPSLWNLEECNLYVASVSVFDGLSLIDEYDVSFGIRTIEFTHDNGFLLNGKRVQIKGVCMHHDLGALGTAVNVSALKRQLTILKGFGCNAIRTSHNIPAPELLELADKMGFLIMNESFDCWSVGKKENDYAALFPEWHEQDLESFVKRDRNHPSVILWSVGNEVAEQYHPELGMARHLREIVRRFDTTRPVTFGASWPKKSAMNGTELQVDVHGMNYPSGGFGGPDFYGDFLSKKGHEQLSGFASETSSTFSSRGVYFPERFQCSSYDLKEPGWGSLPDHEFAALEKYPAICGEFVWTGFDYLGEPIPYNSDETILLNYSELSKEELEQKRKELEEAEKNRPTSRSSYFGIVDLAGFPKDRYYLYQSHWMPDFPMAHILPHWNFPDKCGEKIPVFVYTSGDEAELFLNDRSLGRKKKERYQYRLQWDDVVYEPGELKVIAYKNGKRWAEDNVKTTGNAYELTLSSDKKCIKNNGEDLVFITVKIVDKEGLLVPVAANQIICTLEGDGEIVATDNGDPTSLIPFSSLERPAFGGLMLVVVKSKKGASGNLKLKVSSLGLIGGEISISII